MRPRNIAAAALGAAAILSPAAASAHSPAAGIGGFYGGVLHPLSTPGPPLALLAVALMLGLRFPAGFRAAWGGFALAMLAGIGLGQLGLAVAATELLVSIAALTTAIFAALVPTGARPVALGLSAVAGLMIGLAMTPGPGPVGATLIMLAGSFVGANILLPYLAGGIGWLLETVDQPWLQVGIRVVAAWVAAVAILMTALIAAS